MQEKNVRKNQKTKSVGNGEGSLYRSDKLNCWIFQYYDTNGKRQTMKQRKSETAKDFKIRVTETKNSLNNGSYIKKSDESVVSIAKHYIEVKYSDGTISARTYKRDLSTLAQLENTCSNFCYIPIQNVTIKHIEDAKKYIRIYKNSVIDKIWGLLRKVFKLASSPSRKLLLFNIMEDETLTKPISIKKSEKVRALSNVERTKLINILNNEEKTHKYRNIVKLQLMSGMRIGEVLARSENDYDIKNKTFNIYNTLTQDDNYKVIWSDHTKTFNKKTGIDEGQRFLPLASPLFSEIINIIEEEKRKKVVSIFNTHNLLFWDYENNFFVTPNEVNSWLDRINEKYNICRGSLTTHRLRHSAITLWRELGIPLEVIQYLAGHKAGSNITSDVYIDTSFDFVKDTLNKIS